MCLGRPRDFQEDIVELDGDRLVIGAERRSVRRGPGQVHTLSAHGAFGRT